MDFFLNDDAGGRGGPQVWNGRFRRLLQQRGYSVTNDLRQDWQAALFVNRSQGIELALAKQRPVGYRVANGYLPQWFAVMGHTMQPQHHQANAAIAQALATASHVVYQSHWAKAQLDALLHPRQADFAVIYNGVDLQQFSPAAAPLDAALPVIGTVGVLRYRYRLETVLAMSRRLPFPHRLLIVGDMDAACQNVYRQYLADPHLAARIVHQPHVSPAHLPDLYRQMTLLVHPVCGDVCPNVVVEALACGVPVVAPEFGGTAELVGNAGAIFASEPWVYDDSFITAMTAAVERCWPRLPELGHQARQRAEEALDAERMADAYLDLLGLPRRVEVESATATAVSVSPPAFTWRTTAARLVARPRFYAALGWRKWQQARRRLLPPPANPRPRIAFTLYDFHVGGIENWLYRLARELQGEFDFYFLATTVADFLPKFQTVGHCAYLPGAASMIAFLRRHNIDIVQVHNERWPIDAALAAGVPHVIERTDGTRSCVRVPKHGLQLVIASSRGTVPLIARHIAAENIRLVYNGIDLREVDAVGVQRPFPPDCFLIGRTSRFGRGKNLALLVQAMHQLHATYPQLRLALIGDDSPMPGAEPIAAELQALAAPLGDKVIFPGLQEHTLPWVKGFDVGTCVSNPDNEGIPNSLIEAMACHKPVIATAVDQVAELVEDGVNGLLIPPNDVGALCQAIVRLVEQPAYARQLGAAGRQTVETTFSLDVAARRYAQIYRELLA